MDRYTAIRALKGSSGRPDPTAKTEKRTDNRTDDETYLQEKHSEGRGTSSSATTSLSRGELHRTVKVANPGYGKP